MITVFLATLRFLGITDGGIDGGQWLGVIQNQRDRGFTVGKLSADQRESG